MAFGFRERASGLFGFVVLSWFLFGVCVSALGYEDKGDDRREGSGLDERFSDEEDFTSFTGAARSHFDDDLIWFMESENRFNRMKNPAIDQYSKQAKANTFPNEHHNFEKLDISKHHKNMHNSLHKKSPKISKFIRQDSKRNNDGYGRYPSKLRETSPALNDPWKENKHEKLYGSQKSQFVHTSNVKDKSAEVIVSGAVTTASPFKPVETSNLKHLPVNPYQKPLPTLKTGLDTKSLDQLWHVDHVNDLKDNQFIPEPNRFSSGASGYRSGSGGRQESKKTSWSGLNDTPNYQHSKVGYRKTAKAKLVDGNVNMDSHSVTSSRKKPDDFDIVDSHLEGRVSGNGIQSEKTFGQYRIPMPKDEQSDWVDGSSHVYEKVHSIKFYSSLLPQKREKNTVNHIAKSALNEVDAVEDHELIDGQSGSSRSFNHVNRLEVPLDQDSQSPGSSNHEPSCLRECRQTLASLTISERPDTLMVAAYSQVNMACHVTTGSEVSAVIGWRFGAERDGCIPERLQEEETVRKMWTEDWEEQQARTSPECRRSGFASERISVNQTMIESRLQLNSADSSHSGRYICVARVECCQGNDVYRHLSSSTETILHVFDARGSSHSTASRLAVAAAVITCTLVGLAAAAALLKGCVRRKIVRRLSGSSLSREGYEAVRVYSEDPIFFADQAGTAGNNPAVDDCVGTLIRAKKKQRVRGSEYFSEYTTDMARGDAKQTGQGSSIVTCSASPSIYPNPLDCISPEYEIPLTPDDESKVGQ